MLRVTVNGNEIQVPEGTSVLQACDKAGCFVPRLCYHPNLPLGGTCGLCLVHLNDDEEGTYACATDVEDGMIIDTKSETVKAEAFKAFQIINDNFNLQFNNEVNLLIKHFLPKGKYLNYQKSVSHSIVFTPYDCVDCKRCFRMCNTVQETGALNEETHQIDPKLCISCGQCTAVCPTKALNFESHLTKFMKGLASGRIMCLQTAPSVRVSVGELFGEIPGAICTGKIITAARLLGFKYVFDTNLGADLTIIEEATELIERVTKNQNLPMFTSCCPAWVRFVQQRYPDLIPLLSTAKSPHMMLGCTIKNYFAHLNKLHSKDVFVVSLMPCVAKKEEIKANNDVDAVFTVREFGELIEMYNIDWKTLDDGKFDSPLDESTSASTIFGVTGGVMEAALRYAHEQLTSAPLGAMKYEVVRGFDALRSAEVKVGLKKIKVAICSGISSAKQLINSEEYKKYQFIEVMSCPAGCIGGGGQPKRKTMEEIRLRGISLYKISETKKPSSRDNTEAQVIYKRYFGEPNGERAHKYLHIHW